MHMRLAEQVDSGWFGTPEFDQPVLFRSADREAKVLQRAEA
jgi:hypothetical protein